MDSSILAFLFSAGAVTLAEMGDKTQLLAMGFATKYKPSKVILGVFLATILLNGLAVALGNLLTKFQAIEVWIQGIAALSFIIFGLLTIRGEKEEDEKKCNIMCGAVMTVAIAFFIAELGDKTQLTTIAMAAKFPTSPMVILCGTTIGMLIANVLGIVVGVAACKKIPEKTIKMATAGIFIIFGLIGIYQVALEKLKLGMGATLGLLLLIIVVTLVIGYKLLKKNQLSEVRDFCEERESA